MDNPLGQKTRRRVREQIPLDDGVRTYEGEGIESRYSERTALRVAWNRRSCRERDHGITVMRTTRVGLSRALRGGDYAPAVTGVRSLRLQLLRAARKSTESATPQRKEPSGV